MDVDSKYADSHTPWKNASRLKHVKLSNGDIFLVYEIWSQDSYQYTAYMVVNSVGEV
jgi:hypothetical protein